ncbi:MAG: hypothetical protein IID05_12840 [Gemmatimonadetes bacterium]|nr:hypothetical protein [Gemmatimonadota bacterium]
MPALIFAVLVFLTPVVPSFGQAEREGEYSDPYAVTLGEAVASFLTDRGLSPTEDLDGSGFPDAYEANCFDNSFFGGQTYDLRYAMLSNTDRVTLDVGGREPGQFDAFLSAVYYMTIGGPGSNAEAIGIEIINTIAQLQGGPGVCGSGAAGDAFCYDRTGVAESAAALAMSAQISDVSSQR